MVRRIVLACLVLIFVGGVSIYGQPSQTVKIKLPKKAKVRPVKKPPKPPEPKLTSTEKAIRKANEKKMREQKKAFDKQQRLAARDLKAQQKAYTKVLRAAEKQARKK